MQMLSNDGSEAETTQRQYRTEYHGEGDKQVKLIRREGTREVAVFAVTGRNCAGTSHTNPEAQSDTEEAEQLMISLI